MLDQGRCAFAGRQADEGLFQRARAALAVPRGEIPSRWGDDLVAGNATAADGDPVSQTTAGGFDQAGAFGFVGLRAVGAEGLSRR